MSRDELARRASTLIADLAPMEEGKQKAAIRREAHGLIEELQAIADAQYAEGRRLQLERKEERKEDESESDTD